MRGFIVLVAISGFLCSATAQDIVIDVSQAKVTNDAGTQGNVGYGNLPDPGDEVGWTLPGDFPAGVYRILVDGRTGSSGEGTGFVSGYRVTVPVRAFASGAEPHPIALYWPGEQRPAEKTKGDGYSVFQGDMPARELTYLQPGDLVRVSGGSGWSMVWQLKLRPIPSEEQVEVSIGTGELASIFPGDTGSFEVGVVNWRGEAVNWTVVLSITTIEGKEVEHIERDVQIAARQRKLEQIPVDRKVFGPLAATVSVSDGAQALASALQEFCFSPAPATDQIPENSPFAIHKTDLSEWPAIGAKWVRLWDTGDTWNRYEKERGKIEWEGLDKKVADAEAAGVKILYVFAYTPTWASARPDESHYTGGGARAEAKDINDWKNFVRAVVSRYKGRVDHFEIWNEPNAGFFSGSVDAYVELLKAAYTTAKEANPDCTVLGISGTGGYLPWMEEVLKRDGLKYMDVVAVHTYTTPQSPEGANLLGRMETTHKLIEKYGGNQPVWNTEVGIWQPERLHGKALSEQEIAARAPEDTKPNWQAGWPYRPISELSAAQHCVRMYVLSLASGVKRLFWYAWYSTALPMYTVDNAPRYMSCSYAAMTAKLTGAQFVQRITLGTTDINLCLFQRGEQSLAVAWSTRPEGRQITFRSQKRPTVVDMWGNELPPVDAAISIDESPRYIEGLSIDELATVGLSGERLVFESVDAEVTADVNEKNVREHTSAPHHGDRRVMGLPDAGDEITWTLQGIEPAVYRVELDGFAGWQQPTNHIAKHIVTLRPAGGADPTVIKLAGDPARLPEKVVDVRHYGVMVSTEPVSIGPGDRISVSKTDNWGFIGPLTLVKIAEIAATEAAPCHRLKTALTLDGDLSDWPELPALRIDQRKQAVVGVADAFASTNEHDSWKGPNDLSASVWAAWDVEYLWVAVDVTDDTLCPEPNHGAFYGDCAELFLDLRAPGEVGSGVITEDVYQTFCIAPAEDGTTYEPQGKWPAGAQFATRRTDRGWSLEARIPLAAARFTAQVGSRLGFDIALDDAEERKADAAVRKSQLVWHGTANNFEDPSVYGALQLAE